MCFDFTQVYSPMDVRIRSELSLRSLGGLYVCSTKSENLR
jgi:hypothetical protein